MIKKSNGNGSGDGVRHGYSGYCFGGGLGDGGYGLRYDSDYTGGCGSGNGCGWGNGSGDGSGKRSGKGDGSGDAN